MSRDRPLILVADDDGDIRELLRFRLSQAGYEVETAANGREALDLAIKLRPDLVILDVMMPILNGFEVTAAIRGNEDLADMPVMLLTARVQEEDVQRGFAAGADDYIKKPFSPDELRSRVKTILGRR